MSRIILSRYPSGQEQFVVGWDHAVTPPGAFWTEFNDTPDGELPDDWQEVLREGGFYQGIPLGRFRDFLPSELAPLVTEQVMGMLSDHAGDPDSGYRRAPIDLSHA